MKQPFIYMAILFGVLCMSFSSIIIRYSTAPAMIIAFYRVVFTALLAGAFGPGQIVRDIRSISRRDFYYMLGAGFFLALHFGFWITSLDYTSISSSVLFTNLQVIFVLTFSIIFLKEKVNHWVIGGILVALVGSMLIAHGDLQSGKIFGDVLALLSGLFVAIYFLISRNIRSRVGALTFTGVASAVAVLVLMPGCQAFGLSLTGYPAADWFGFILLALGPGIGGHAVLNWALKYVKAPIVAVSILGESVGASILAFLFFRELLLWYQMIGGLLILAGIYAAAAKERVQVN